MFSIHLIRDWGPGKIRKATQFLMLGGQGSPWADGVRGTREKGSRLGLSGRQAEQDDSDRRVRTS